MILDPTVDQILEASSIKSNNIINRLLPFDNGVEKFDKAYVIYSQILNSEDSTKYCNNIQQLQEMNFKDTTSNVLRKNTSYVEKVSQEIEQLKVSETNLLRLIANNEKELRAVDAKILHIRKKEDNLQDSRDKIQFCKILTNTSFIYKGKKIRGYAVGQQTGNIESFELDAEILSKDDITRSLYDVVKKASDSVEVSFAE